MFASHSRGKRRNAAKQLKDNVLAVLTDTANGAEYYVSIIDVFEFKKREYSVMYHYRPEQAATPPEIVVMRSYRGEDGSRYFTSIRRPKELDLVFELFTERYHTAQAEESRAAADEAGGF